MAVDIFNIPENVISRDLKGRFICIYGAEKVGKSTFGAKLPRPLFCNFEVGTNYLPVKPVNIDRWSVFKQVLRQLEKPEAHDYYDTVVIDTVSEAYAACEKFVCQQNGVQKIADIPWGAGYTACKKEFESSLREITRLGYGVVLIAHSASRVEKTADGSDVEIISPDLPKRAAEICNGIVDIIGYIGNEWVNGERKRWLYTRETPTLFAGSRFKYMPDKIPFGYTELVNAIADAIEMAEKQDGATVVDTAKVKTETTLNFNDVRTRAQELWTKLVGSGEEANPEMATAILKRIEMTMGRKMKLSEFTEDQCDLLNLVVQDMEEMVK